MLSSLLLHLFINILLFLSFGYLLNRVRPFTLNHESSFMEKLLYSLSFGMLAIVAILFSYDIGETKMDLRIVPITLAGLYGGPFTGFLAGLWPSIFRLSAGINDVTSIGTAYIITCGMIMGFISKWFWKDIKNQIIALFVVTFYYATGLVFMSQGNFWGEALYILIALEFNYSIGMYISINQIQYFKENHAVKEQMKIQKEKLEIKTRELESQGIALKDANEHFQSLNTELTTSQAKLMEVINQLDLNAKEASDAKNRLLAVLDSVDEAVIVTDPKGQVIYMGKRTEELLGLYPHSNIKVFANKVDMNLPPIINAIVSTNVFQQTSDFIDNNPAAINNSIYNLYEEHGKVISRFTSPVIDKSTGNILGRVFVFRDITKEYLREQERNKIIAIEATLGDFAYNATLMFEEKDILSATENIIKRLVPSDFGAISLVDDHRLPMRPDHIWCFRDCKDFEIGNIEVAGRCKAILAGQMFKVAQDKNNIPCKCYPINTMRASYMCVPLTAMGKTFGIIHVGNHTNNEFSHELEETLVRIASIAAMGISNLRLIEATKEQAVTDHLTKLYNKKYLDEYLTRELTDEANYPLSMLVLDVDKFKNINDTYGHSVGDEILIALSNTVKSSVRNSDIVGRYGGEEFEVLLPQTSYDIALMVAEKVRKAVEVKSIRTAAGDLKITISIGVATSPIHGIHKMELFKASDQALYQAKEWGRNRVVGFAQLIEERQSNFEAKKISEEAG